MRILIAILAALMIAGCGGRAGTSPPSPAQATVSHSEVRQGPFVLAFDLPKTDWAAGEVIDGVATLSLANGPGVELGGSGSGLIGFGFAEVNGTRHMEPVWTADCAPLRLDPAAPLKAAVKTSGSVSADQPDAAFYGAFLADPHFRLPVGDWDISAVASFLEGSDCTGASHALTTKVRVHILP